MGFRVHAVDGPIGKISYSTRDVDVAHIVVDTGHWITGKRVILPAGTVERIDWDNESVYVDRSKEQIKNAPQLEDTIALDLAVQEELSKYYRDV